MTKKRAPLGAGLDSDIGNFAGSEGKTKKLPINQNEARNISREAGFPSREAPKTRDRRNVSPYALSKGYKVRSGMHALIIRISDELGVKDHTMHERALLALIEKDCSDDLKAEFERLTK